MPLLVALVAIASIAFLAAALWYRQQAKAFLQNWTRASASEEKLRASLSQLQNRHYALVAQIEGIQAAFRPTSRPQSPTPGP